MLSLSAELNRTLGLLIDRRGNVEYVVLGDAQRLYLPDLGRARAGGLRLRGVRLWRTQLQRPNLEDDDLTDLHRLRLDLVGVIHQQSSGDRVRGEWAHLWSAPIGETPWMKHSIEGAASLEIPFADLIMEIETSLDDARAALIDAGDDDRAMLVYVRTRHDRHWRASLRELRELAKTARLSVVDIYVQSRAALDPKFGVGRGALEEIELRALQQDLNLLVFGQDLSAAQLRSITNSTQLRVIDRTQLILDIFAQRATTASGKLQVELAQLRYSLPRLAGKGSAMSRLAGGIGARGPGETKLEQDRRRARDRIRSLEKQLDVLSTRRQVQRKGRVDNRVPVISIIGYTNAGKSTLLGTLTKSEIAGEDKLFATLSPMSRRLRLPRETEVVLTDTVGFIRDLPEALRMSFRATLEELDHATLLLQVVDASDQDWFEQMKSTDELLETLELSDKPRLLVFNKADEIDDEERLEIEWQHPDAVFISALHSSTVTNLVEAIEAWLINNGYGSLVSGGDATS